jgi:hypothetical protein
MEIFIILIPFIIFTLIIGGIIILVRLISLQRSFAEATFSIAVSWDDLIRQLLLGISLILGLVGIYAISQVLKIPIGWYYFAVIGGIITAIIGYRKHSPLVFVVGIIEFLLGIIIGSYQVASQNGVDISISFIVAFLLFASLYTIAFTFFEQSRNKRYYTVLTLIGVLGLGILSFVLGAFSSRNIWETITNTTAITIWNNPKTLIILLGVIAVFGISSISAWKKIKSDLYKGIGILIGLAGALFVIFLPKVPVLYDPNQPYFYDATTLADKNREILPHIISLNSIFLIGVLWLLYSAYKLKEIWRLNLSILALFGFILVRYFDWVEKTELDRSIFFLGLGIVFLITGYFLERIRRNVLASIDN